MNRRNVLQGLAALIALPLLPSCSRAVPPQAAAAPAMGTGAAAASEATAATAGGKVVPLKKPHSEWRKVLSPAAYAVLFEEGTERPFSSPLDKEKRAGTFLCAACYLPLFTSANKFDSGTGWPSFTREIAGHTATTRDFKMIVPRTEYHCARCGGHQGHIFDDGPAPLGKRWCNNGVALRFVPKDQSLPALRS